jgi:hypothetical protein
MTDSDFIKNARYLQSDVHKEFQNIGPIMVRPSSIHKVVPKTELVNHDLLQDIVFFKYFIIGGSWDLKSNAFHEDRDFELVKDLYDYGNEYQESNAYLRNIEEIRTGQGLKGFNGKVMLTIDDVRKTFEYYLELFRSIQFQGYENNLTTHESRDNVGVAIDRNGHYLHFRTGHHRLAISKILDLEWIPVTVHAVHEEWVLKLDEYNPNNEIEIIVEALRRKRGEFNG